jgi:hypothetical protein
MSGLTQSVIATAQRALNPGSAVLYLRQSIRWSPLEDTGSGRGANRGVIFHAKWLLVGDIRKGCRFLKRVYKEVVL